MERSMWLPFSRPMARSDVVRELQGKHARSGPALPGTATVSWFDTVTLSYARAMGVNVKTGAETMLRHNNRCFQGLRSLPRETRSSYPEAFASQRHCTEPPRVPSTTHHGPPRTCTSSRGASFDWTRLRRVKRVARRRGALRSWKAGQIRNPRPRPRAFERGVGHQAL
jgi:hypothetical protein